MSDTTALTSLLKKATQNTIDGLSHDELSHLLTSFVPTNPSPTQSEAYLVLSTICESIRSRHQGRDEDELGTSAILRIFLPAIESRLTDVEEAPILEALSFTAALFAVDWRSASSTFQRDGFQDSMIDSLDLFPSSKWLPRMIASLLAQACGHRGCRAVISPRCTSWLQSTAQQTKDPNVQATIALTQVKFAQGSDTDTSAMGNPEKSSLSKNQVELLQIMKNTIINSADGLGEAAVAIEGLAYLSSVSSIKERVIIDSALLRHLVSFRLPAKTNENESIEGTPATALYGLSIIMSNLCAYRPRLTEEEAQIEKLRRMAQPSSTDPVQAKEVAAARFIDDDERVKQRGNRLVEAGVVDLLVYISRATNSQATRTVVGKAILSLVEVKENRGRILQAGGAKALMTIIRTSFQETSSKLKAAGESNLVASDLLPIQALAKLAITSSPLQVFGPNDSLVYDTIRPLATLLLHRSSTLLQRFESLMALTNLSSASAETSSRIAKAGSLLNKVEFLLLDENVMIRRAATELMCNLVAGSDEVYGRYSGDASSETPDVAVKSRLQILVALSDVEDASTRLAASGALATLTTSPVACDLLLSLELDRHRVLPALKQLIDPLSDDDQSGETIQELQSGLMHRGVVCLRNLLANAASDGSREKLAQEADKAGLVPSLIQAVKTVQGKNWAPNMIRPAAEALKVLMDSGVKLIRDQE